MVSSCPRLAVKMSMKPSPEISVCRAILLVAGRGSRLDPITSDLPKCLIEIEGRSLLERLLDQLESIGIEEVVLATGYLHEKLEAAVAQWNHDLSIVTAYTEDYATENNAVSLGGAMEALGGEGFLLIDGDVLLLQGRRLQELAADTNENVLTVMRPEAMGAEEMKVEVDEATGRILRLGKGLEEATAFGESLGIQKIGPKIFDELLARLNGLSADERRDLYYEDVFAELIDDGADFFARQIPIGEWTEIDTVEDLEAARAMAASWSS